MLNLKENNYMYFVESNSCVIQFSAPWCGPCKAVSAILDSISLDDKKIEIAKIDIADIPQSSSEFNIKAFPTTICFKDGKEVSRVIGSRSKNDFVDFINKSFL